MKKAVIYARYSSDNQDDATIETQLRECRQKAATLNATVIREYCDIAQSGRSNKREKFKQMLFDAKLKGFNLVIVRKFDRFARNILDARLTEQHLEKYGIKLISCHESFDDSTSAGWFSKQMVHLVNEWYSRNLATETISGMETNTRKGFRCGGTAPYGFKNVKVLDESTKKMRTKLEIEPKEAEVVILVFNMYKNGNSLGKIIEELESRNFLPRKAKKFSKSAISQMVKNDVYIGTITWRKTKDPSGWIKTDNAAPAIIDQKTWNACQTIVERNRRVSPRSKGSVHPLSGMIKCGVCGSSFVIHSKQDGKWRYYCSGRVRKTGCSNSSTIFEDELIKKTKKALINEIFTEQNIFKGIQQMKNEMSSDIKKFQSKLAKAEKELRAIEEKQISLVEVMASGDLPKKIVQSAINKSEIEKSGLEKQIEELKKEIELSGKQEITKDDVAFFTAVVRSSLNFEEPNTLRAAFKKAGVSIVINKKFAKITIAPTQLSKGIVLESAGDGT